MSNRDWDAKGNKIEQKFWGSDGRLWSWYVYAYDAKGNKIEQNDYGSDGNLQSKCVCAYDAKGNQIERSCCNWDCSQKNVWTQELVYDEQGNWIKQVAYKNGFPEEIILREFEYY